MVGLAAFITITAIHKTLQLLQLIGHAAKTDEVGLNFYRVKPKLYPEPPIEKVRGRPAFFGAVKIKTIFNLLFWCARSFGATFAAQRWILEKKKYQYLDTVFGYFGRTKSMRGDYSLQKEF